MRVLSVTCTPVWTYKFLCSRIMEWLSYQSNYEISPLWGCVTAALWSRERTLIGALYEAFYSPGCPYEDHIITFIMIIKRDFMNSGIFKLCKNFQLHSQRLKVIILACLFCISYTTAIWRRIQETYYRVPFAVEEKTQSGTEEGIGCFLLRQSISHIHMWFV